MDHPVHREAADKLKLIIKTYSYMVNVKNIQNKHYKIYVFTSLLYKAILYIIKLLNKYPECIHVKILNHNQI